MGLLEVVRWVGWVGFEWGLTEGAGDGGECHAAGGRLGCAEELERHC